MVAKRSARSERTQAINQARALIVTGPDDLRARFAAHITADLVTDLAALRPRPGAVIGYHTRIALRELGRRAEFLDSQLARLDDLIVPLLTGHAPGLLALHGVGSDTAALLLVAAGDHPERLRSEAAWAHLCATAPIPASSGKTARHRLNPAGDRQANHALWRIVLTRMSSCPPTRAYVERRTAEGLPGKRSCAASSGTSPARSTPTSAAPLIDPTALRGRPDPLFGCRTQVLAFYRFVGRPRPYLTRCPRDLIRACPPPGVAPPCLVRTQQPQPENHSLKPQRLKH